MIKKFEITGVHVDADEKLRKYVAKRINKLERYIPKAGRESAHAEVFLTEKKRQSEAQCTAEIIMHLPKETLAAKESTINLFAAVDIVEAKLKNQLKKYKETHSAGLSRHLAKRLKRQ